MKEQENNILKEFYPNSEKLWVEYEINDKGQNHGYFKRYDINGKLNMHCHFINDSRIGMGKHYENGKAFLFNCHIGGREHGVEIRFEYNRKKKK